MSEIRPRESVKRTSMRYLANDGWEFKAGANDHFAVVRRIK